MTTNESPSCPTSIRQNKVFPNTARRLFDFFGDVVGSSGVSPSDSAFVDNVVSKIDRMPLYIFLDIAAAFPSLAHKFLFIVLHALRPPAWFLNFVKILYTDNFAVNHSGQHKFWILAGILQGCGLSGSLFALSFDPFLSAIEQSIDNRNFGQTRACADDVGSALKALGHLKRIAIVFGWAAECASLCLNLLKTILVPLGAPCTPTVIDAIRNWLQLNLPQWTQVKIQDQAKYLGFILGPKAGESSWHAPFAKFKDRVSAIALATKGPTINLHTYNSLAVPVLSYICQLLPPTNSMLEFELHAFHKILHMAYTFKRSQMFNLPSLGGPAIRSIGAMCYSALHRTSRDTVRGIPEAFRTLRESVLNNLPFQSYNVSVMAPFFWNWKPFVAHLNEAQRCQFSFGAKTLKKPMHRAAEYSMQKLSQKTDSVSGTQKVFYDCFCAEVFLKDPNSDILQSSFVKLGNSMPVLAELLSNLDLKFLQTWLNRLPNGILFPILKTWSNAWSTTCRIHCTVQLTCVFGCQEAPDDLKHYVSCPVLWKVVGLDDLDLLPEGVVKRLSLLDPSFSSFKNVAKAFHLYNQARKHHSENGVVCNLEVSTRLAKVARHLVDSSRCPSDPR